MMGTKNNPGEFDCYAKAGPDEPIFTLRAKDPFAADMVELWRLLAIGDICGAVSSFNDLVQIAVGFPHKDMDYDSDKSQEAYACHLAMRDWREVQ